MRPCERRGRVGVAISSSPGRGDGRDERDLRPSGMLLSMPSLEREERERRGRRERKITGIATIQNVACTLLCQLKPTQLHLHRTTPRMYMETKPYT